MPETGPSIIEPPFGLLCLSAALRKNNYDPVILDTRFDNYRQILSQRYLEDILAVGITCMTGPQIHHTAKIAKHIKRESARPVILGGIHPTILPEETLREEFVDYIVLGYAEKALINLLDIIREGRLPEGEPNIAYKKDGSIFVNPRNFDALELPLEFDWDAIDVSRYLSSATRLGEKVLSMFTSNGCPSKCTFCYGPAFHNKRWRGQSAEEVLRDVGRLSVSGLDAVYFRDDNFFADKKRAFKIARGMREMGIPFGLAIRADYADEDLVRKLKEYGCVQIDWGTESGSQRILDLYRKGILLEDIRRTAKLTAKYSIKAYTTILMGHPEEGRREILATMDFVDELLEINPELTISDIKILSPYPGSELYCFFRDQGVEFPEKFRDWNRFNWNTSNVIESSGARFLNIISMVTLFAFCDWRIKKKSPIYNASLHILHHIELFRWRRRFFRFPLELDLARLVLFLVNRRVLPG